MRFLLLHPHLSEMNEVKITEIKLFTLRILHVTLHVTYMLLSDLRWELILSSAA